jgi:hypothetical protein
VSSFHSLGGWDIADFDFGQVFHGQSNVFDLGFDGHGLRRGRMVGE